MTNSTIAQVYVGCALTTVPDALRRTLKKDVANIVIAVDHVREHDGWSVYAYDAISHTAPFDVPGDPAHAPLDARAYRAERKDGAAYTPAEIWEIDTRKVLIEADAVIIHGFAGGSTGVGMELHMASTRGIPVLYLHHETTSVSRIVKGMPGNVEIHEFVVPEETGSRDHLRDIVVSWLRRQRPKMEPGPRRRAIQRELLQPELSTLRERWEHAGARGDRERAAQAALFTPAEVELLLTHELRVANLPHVRLLMLSRALDAGTDERAERSPLSAKEAEWLQRAADEYDWGEEFTTALAGAAHRHRQGRSTVARATTGRHNLESISGWVEFADDWTRGRLR